MKPILLQLPRRLTWPLRVARLGPRIWLDLACAVAELVIARWKLGNQPIAEMQPSTSQDHAAAVGQPLSQSQMELIGRVSFAIIQAAARVPWRSDCLVQALAARRWLLREGIASALCIGAKNEGKGFEAHAWLACGECIVTGGDIASWAQFQIGSKKP